MLSQFLLGLILAQLPESVERYRLNDFYYYNQDGKVEALPLRSKILFSLNENFWLLSEETKLAFFRQLVLFGKSEIIKNFSLRKITDRIVIVEFDSEQIGAKEIVEFLNRFPEYQKLLRYPVGDALPIVVWQGREVMLPVNRIFLETKPSITDPEQLKVILKSFWKLEFEITRPDSARPNRFEVVFKELDPPLNIFVLANLIAEDKIHFQWAQPEFFILEEPVTAKMYVTSNGIDSLGDKRFLHLEISIASSKINILKDLVPQLGEGEFVLNVQSYNDIWFWADKPVITEIEKDGLKLIKFVWPFIYLEVGNFTFKDIAIAYEENNSDGSKTENSLTVKGCLFQIGSVIGAAPAPVKTNQPEDFLSEASGNNIVKETQPLITDIQPVHNYLIKDSPKPEKSSTQKSFWIKLKDWLWLPGAGIGLFLVINNVGLIFSEARRRRQEIYDAEEDRLKEWDQLKTLLQNLSLENWTDYYPKIEGQLKQLIKKFLLPPSINSTTADNSLLKEIFRELEKIYRGEEVNNNDLTALKTNLEIFINWSCEQLHC